MVQLLRPFERRVCINIKQCCKKQLISEYISETEQQAVTDSEHNFRCLSDTSSTADNWPSVCEAVSLLFYKHNKIQHNSVKMSKKNHSIKSELSQPYAEAL